MWHVTSQATRTPKAPVLEALGIQKESWHYTMKRQVIRFFIWLSILLPISVLTSDWLLVHVILLGIFLTTVVTFLFHKENRKYVPFSIAFLLSLSIAIGGYGTFKKWGISDVLPQLLGQE